MVPSSQGHAQMLWVGGLGPKRKGGNLPTHYFCISPPMFKQLVLYLDLWRVHKTPNPLEMPQSFFDDKWILKKVLHLTVRGWWILAAWNSRLVNLNDLLAHPANSSKNLQIKNVYQEEKHCLVLITHLGLTRDPPQKWFPFLHTRGRRSYTAQQQDVFDLLITSSQTHLSLRLTVHGELPGIPFTIRNRVFGVRSSLFPHSLNSTLSAFTKRRHIFVRKKQKENAWESRLSTMKCCLQLIQKLTYWLSHGHFLSSCLETQETDELLNCQQLWLNCHHAVH